jgi:hypothetical protein
MGANDFFGEVFASEGFGAAYSRKLNPPTRQERVAAFEANREAHEAAKAAAINTAVLGIPAQPADSAAAVSEDKSKAALAAFFTTFTREEIVNANEAILDVELDRGFVSDTPPDVDDEFYVDETGTAWVLDDADEWVEAS